jgi:hypothetical protein
MRNFLIALLVIAVIVVGLGVYLDWFNFSSTDRGSGKVDVGVTIDKEKMKEDAEKAAEKAKELGKSAKEKVNDSKPKSP